MDADQTQNPHDVAVEQLEHLGLSSYAAQTFVALASLGSGTARDVSEVSSVPRSRVYDAVEELHNRGLVDIQQSSPKEFWAISSETAMRSFIKETEHRTSVLQEALEALEPPTHRTMQSGVWTVDGETAVTERVLEFFRSAEDEIVYMSVDDLLTEELIEELAAAADRDVSIRLAGVSEEVQERIQEEIPSATVFESLWLWSDTSAGRLMMVDNEKTLVSVLVNGPDAPLDDPRDETAIWGQGHSNSLVVVLRAIFTWRLENRPDSDG